MLDATSAGILLWAGLVECLAHDFVFDRQSASSSFSVSPPQQRRREMEPPPPTDLSLLARLAVADASNGEVTYAVMSVFTGAGLMALLGRWA